MLYGRKQVGEEQRQMQICSHCLRCEYGKIVRNFAIGLALLIILTPLGLLAVGETSVNGDVRNSMKSLAMFPQVLRSFPDFGALPSQIMPFQAASPVNPWLYRLLHISSLL